MSQMSPISARPPIIKHDLRIRMRDGVHLAANVFLPGHGAWPTILSVTPYGKDKLPDRIGMALMRVSGVRFGRLDCSSWTGFESPDPLFWTRAGYAVVQVDVRGMHNSEGHAGMLTNADAHDYAELIGWAAGEPWSTGAVGLLGVSYLAMSQWRVAALRPPGLRAIVPWEGTSDMLREFAYQDGVVETGFIGIWWKNRMRRGHNRLFKMAEDFPKDRDHHSLDDAYWAGKRPDLQRIECPALVCAGWADQGLHTRGSLEGFERIGSKEKWLFTHGGRKWETFYSAEAKDFQLRFLDRYVKGELNDWETTPRVRLAVRSSRSVVHLREADSWPVAASYTPLHLDAASKTMAPEPTVSASVASYDPQHRTSRASFSYRFMDDVELTGSMALTLWVETTKGDDLDIFTVLRKFDTDGEEVHFYGYNGLARDGVAKGWLRASHRELDPDRSRPGRPFHTHRVRAHVRPGKVVRLEIEVQASSTLFEAGSTLRLDVLGTDAERYPAFRHRRTVNRGYHRIHTGGSHPSNLLIPIAYQPESA